MTTSQAHRSNQHVTRIIETHLITCTTYDLVKNFIIVRRDESTKSRTYRNLKIPINCTRKSLKTAWNIPQIYVFSFLRIIVLLVGTFVSSSWSRHFGNMVTVIFDTVNSHQVESAYKATYCHEGERWLKRRYSEQVLFSKLETSRWDTQLTEISYFFLQNGRALLAA